MNVLSAAYGGAARLRRAWYARRPDARRRLERPVVSVGNLVVGGSGKTPVVAALARLLLAAGERPAILSRGYARRQDADGVVVVSDGDRVLEPVARAGDEPLMLARALPGVPVLVAAERYLAGCVAIRRLGATVLLLDDGFQHLQLARDVDLLLVNAADLHERVLPSGRLREPITSARAADAVLVAAGHDAADVARTLGVPQAFTVVQEFDALRALAGGPIAAAPGARVLAVAGIARPARFFAALRAHGLDVVREMTFADHHWYSARDVARITAAARDVQAELIVTTEKDAVRVETLAAGGDVAWAWLPLRVTIQPAAGFAAWLRSRW